MTHCVEPGVAVEQRYNIVNVELASEVLPNLQSLERHFYTTSACGVCGKTSLEALRLREYGVIPPGLEVKAEVLYSLPEKLRSHQRIYASTGGYTPPYLPLKGTC